MLSVTRRNQIAYFFFEALLSSNCISDEAYAVIRIYAKKSGMTEWELWQFDLNNKCMKMKSKKSTQKGKETKKRKH